MASRNRDRSQNKGQGRGRNPNNDYDWDYYYEYRSFPYDLGGYYYDRDYADYGNYGGRDYYDNNMYYGRNTDYNHNDFGYSNETYYGRNRGQGQYSGYGPRGYRRSDERIQDDVNDRLTWDGRIDATDVHVEVKDGVCTLSGSVDSRRDKRVAEDIADHVSGVWDINNQIRVRNRGYYRGWQGTTDRDQIREGMDVVDSDGQRVGTVKEVRDNDFLVDRSMARDVFVPFDECTVEDRQVRLNVMADQVENQGWEVPETVESQRSQRKR